MVKKSQEKPFKIRTVAQAKKIVENHRRNIAQRLQELAEKDQEINVIQSRLRSIDGENTRLMNVLNEERLAKARIIEERDLAQRRHQEAVAERDRLLRMVDQFTSVQIISHGSNLQQGVSTNDTPRSLRNGNLVAVK